MKKLLLPALPILLSGLLLTSCDKRRDWTCDCTIDGKATPSMIVDEEEEDARTVCDGVVRTAQTNKLTASCSLRENE